MHAAAEIARRGDKPPPKLLVLSFRPVIRNTLRGFVTVQFGSGLKLIDCPVHVHPGGRAWVALPAKGILVDDDRHKLDAGTGKPVYTPVAEWRDRATSDRFSAIVIELLRLHYPGAIDGSRAS